MPGVGNHEIYPKPHPRISYLVFVFAACFKQELRLMTSMENFKCVMLVSGQHLGMNSMPVAVREPPVAATQTSKLSRLHRI